MANDTSQSHQPKVAVSSAATSRSGVPSRAYRGMDQDSSQAGDKPLPNKRRKIRRNALKHGLSIPVSKLPYFQGQIEGFYQALLKDVAEYIALNDEIQGICYEIAVQQCELRRISKMKSVLSSRRLGRAQPFSQSDIIHLITVVEGFIIPPRDKPIPFDARAMSMLYRIFGIRTSDASMDTGDIGSGDMGSGDMGSGDNDLTYHQIKRLSSFERYETRSSIRLRKAVKRLGAALKRTAIVNVPVNP